MEKNVAQDGMNATLCRKWSNLATSTSRAIWVGSIITLRLYYVSILNQKAGPSFSWDILCPNLVLDTKNDLKKQIGLC